MPNIETSCGIVASKKFPNIIMTTEQLNAHMMLDSG